MKTIKFRYWDMVRNQFITDGDVYFVAEDAIFAGDLGNPPVVDITGNVLISQFTGLHDKNGKEIYEGDIVQTYSGDKGEIIFKNGMFQRKINKDWGQDLTYPVLIIGNIYENPELLEQTT